jgi:hypothetical protein
MGDFGIKISEVGKDVNTSDLDDTSFDSRYHSLMLLEKKTVEFSALQGQTGQYGSEVYAHGLGYAPFTMGFVAYTLYTDSVTDIIPHVYDNATPGGSNIYIDIALKIDTTNITLDWSVEQTVAGSPEGLDNDIDFTVTLDIYSLKLGYTT